MSKRPEPVDKHALMGELLAALGWGKLSLDEFNRRIKQAGMSSDDIDRYFERERENERTPRRVQ